MAKVIKPPSGRLTPKKADRRASWGVFIEPIRFPYDWRRGYNTQSLPLGLSPEKLEYIRNAEATMRQQGIP